MNDRPAALLTVVSVLYRSAGILTETLPTWVRGATGRPVEFVFVDNSAEPAAEKLIAELFAGLRYAYVADAGNPGFAAGCNKALAFVHSGHMMLLNPDVWLHEDSLDRVLAAIAEDPAHPIAVGLAMHGDEFAGIEAHLLGLFADRRAGSARPPIGPSGGAAVLPVRLYQDFGGLYEPMFAWGEDADLAFRLAAAGVGTRALLLGLPHAVGHSVEGDTGLSEFRAFLLARNRLWTAARSLTGPLLVAAAPLLIAAHAALAVRRARQGQLRAYLRGVARGLAGAPAARRSWRGRRFGLRTLRGRRRAES